MVGNEAIDLRGEGRDKQVLGPNDRPTTCGDQKGSQGRSNNAITPPVRESSRATWNARKAKHSHFPPTRKQREKRGNH